MPKEAGSLKRWLGLVVLGLPTVLLSLDMSVLYLALPRLSTDLGAGQTEQLWVTDVYGLVVAGLLITMGNLGDRIGRRRLLLIGAVIFGIASVIAAFAPTIEVLIAARALLGIAGATVAPSTLALISNLFTDERQRAIAIGAWMCCFMGGNAVGPLVGGLLLEHFWWGSVFLIAVPVMIILLVAGPFLLPEFRAPKAGRIDLPSVALSLAAILPFVFGVKEFARGAPLWLSLLPVIVGVTSAVIFVRRQRRLTDPLLQLRLFAEPTFRTVIVIMVVSASLMGGTFLLLSLYLQTVAQLTPIQAGIWLLPQMVVMIISSLAAPVLLRWVRRGLLIFVGIAVTMIGFAILALTSATGGPLIPVIGFTVACGGIGGATALATDLVVGSAPPDQAGAASAISETGNELGIGLGIALLGSVGTLVYRASLGAAAGPEVNAGISKALAVAATLPSGQGEVLAATARQAFTHGLVAVAVLGTVVLAAVAVASWLRLARTGGDPTPSVPDAEMRPEQQVTLR
ncbi:MFS transporter [Microlunatus parietis]|uniref:DHA2 family multidrug resistance protein-like MFS transporter n=1 Tax=Microlunatus parietis TaxID=682979 RepID=A0A7Y9LDH2_9ACTN|nr:MFS transporter [Microlunatus parietis]NYE72868.1 DHA2 family multidrug resistance protein-like MFS transporter [Microlunatus parietis]